MNKPTNLDRETLALLDIMDSANAIEKEMLRKDEQRLWELPCKKCQSTKKKVWQKAEFSFVELHIKCLDCGNEFVVDLAKYRDRVEKYSLRVAKNSIR